VRDGSSESSYSILDESVGIIVALLNTRGLLPHVFMSSRFENA
jgi:hypothetical protein